MTAYILTPEQHAQIVDALEYSTPIAEFDDMQSEATAQIEHNTALAMLKEMKPVEPKAWVTQSGSVTGPVASNNTLHDGDLYGWQALYAKEQQ